jgi:hypothetical protein
MQISFFISAKILRLIRAFSLKRNLRTLLDTESTQNDIHCLNGIRSLNALTLIIFHKSVALFFNPYVNRTYMAEVKERCNWIQSYCSVTFRKKDFILSGNYKGKAIPLQAWTGPKGFRRLRLPDCKTIVT